MQETMVDLANALRERLAIIRDEESRRDQEKHGRDSAPSRKKSTNCKRRSHNRSTRNWRISFSSAAATTRRSSLSRIQLDDQLFVDDRLHFFARRNVRDFAFESVAIDGQPIGNRHDLGELEIAQDRAGAISVCP